MDSQSTVTLTGSFPPSGPSLSKSSVILARFSEISLDLGRFSSDEVRPPTE
uniref:Uncharacterized protein n=1 Tax=Fagus sylvatica TaxID=28930 RepID=A0A2N9I8L5_FAGSY